MYLVNSEIFCFLTKSESSRNRSKVDDLYPTVTPLEAFNALDTSLQWLESQGTDPDHLLLVKKWRDTAARMRQESLKQTKITRMSLKMYS